MGKEPAGSVPAACGTGDARNVAAHLIDGLRAAGPTTTVLAFGNAEAMEVAVGERHSLRVRGVAWQERSGGAVVAAGDALGAWEQIGRFLEDHRGETVVGFLGFELHAAAGAGLAATGEVSTLLVVPDGLARVEGGAPRAGADGPRSAGGAAGDHVVDVPPDLLAVFGQRVGSALRWVRERPEARATVALRVPVPFPVDLPASLAPPVPDGVGGEISRSFYAFVDGFEFVGTSPELLATGSAEQFSTYKLSGTYARSPSSTTPEAWRERFLADERIQREHTSSVAGVTRYLARLGPVERSPREVLVLPDLLHLLTKLTTTPAPGATVVGCVRSVFPAGLTPYPEGLSLLASVEGEGRGPYYGLFGRVEPSGRFEWSQVLRAVFKSGQEQWIHVGAAVTPLSTPELECAEIGVKCRSVRLRGGGGGDQLPRAVSV